MEQNQSFVYPGENRWVSIDFLPGVDLLPLAQPVPEGSIHRACLAKGTVIPIHTHPCDEYVLVLSGVIKTDEQTCEQGTFWTTRAGTRQGPHIAFNERGIAYDSAWAYGSIWRKLARSLRTPASPFSRRAGATRMINSQ